MPDQAILVINAGSSSIKYGLYRARDMACLARENFQFHKKTISYALYEETFQRILKTHKDVRVCAAGHRIVHGGPDYRAPVRLDETVLKTLKGFKPLAPLHQPYNLAAVESMQVYHPDLLQVACFDTAFHRTQPRLNQLYALPHALSEEGGLIRYGFHGLSYEYIASVLPQHTDKALGKVITLHLGAGVSACAMSEGKSVATTMGFTALDGLMMATRCGALDPGLVLYLLQEKQMSAAAVKAALYDRSGLLGVSGISGDMRDLIDNPDPRAQQAVDLFCRYIVRAVGQLATDLQGLDALVFTAGIGENQPKIKDKVSAALAWLGDFEVLVIPTDEEKIIAQHVKKFL